MAQDLLAEQHLNLYRSAGLDLYTWAHLSKREGLQYLIQIRRHFNYIVLEQTQQEKKLWRVYMTSSTFFVVLNLYSLRTGVCEHIWRERTKLETKTFSRF